MSAPFCVPHSLELNEFGVAGDGAEHAQPTRDAQNWYAKFTVAIVLSLAAIIAPLSPLSAQTPPASLPEILEALNDPIILTLKNGNQQTGNVTQWDGETMQLEVSLGGGSAALTFPRSDIRQITFPGGEYLATLFNWMQDPERVGDAMTLFRAYYQQRGAYFDLLDERELGLFISYANFALEQDSPLRAVAMIDKVKPHIKNETVLAEIEENLLLAFFEAGMREEAETKAQDWIQSAEPAGVSALGWRLLAELSFANEDYEKAFWTALHPVTFSNQMPMKHLDTCYAFAIIAATELRLKEEPIRLAKEMRARGFSWPEDIDILAGKAPEAFTADPMESTLADEQDGESAAEGSLTEEEPIQTPSPVDPVEELPTRINL